MAPQVERHQTEKDPGCHSQLSVGISHGVRRLRGKYLLEMNFTEGRNPATRESDLLILSPDAPSEARSVKLGFSFRFCFHLHNICVRQKILNFHSKVTNNNNLKKRYYSLCITVMSFGYRCKLLASEDIQFQFYVEHWRFLPSPSRNIITISTYIHTSGNMFILSIRRTSH